MPPATTGSACIDELPAYCAIILDNIEISAEQIEVIKIGKIFSKKNCLFIFI